MKIFLKTSRLLLRQFNDSDLNDLFDLDRDPAVMKYIRKPATSIEESRKNLEKYFGYYHKHEHLGYWVIALKETKQFVGIATLRELEDTDEKEVGYRFAKQFWGKGYATEITKALIEYGFEKAGFNRIVAVVSPENINSQHVLEKGGMKFEKEVHHYGEHLFLYSIQKVS